MSMNELAEHSIRKYREQHARAERYRLALEELDRSVAPHITDLADPQRHLEWIREHVADALLAGREGGPELGGDGGSVGDQPPAET